MMINKNIPVVILCGGKGTRMPEMTEFMPKPLVRIDNVPILVHIMKLYSYYGFNNFVLLLGYKGEMIKEYFDNYRDSLYNYTLNMHINKKIYHTEDYIPDWKISFIDTGQETTTGGRLQKVASFLKSENEFFLTYGDGVANINIIELLKFHYKKNKTCTITAVKPFSKYGVVNINNKDEAIEFLEKPMLDDYISGGFMVMNKRFLEYLIKDKPFEIEVMPKLAKKKQIAVYKHNGFWHSMDTYKDYLDLNQMVKDKKDKWRVWEK